MKLWLCMFAGGDNMKSDYSFDDDVTQAASFVSPQQTAVSTENSDLFTSFPLLLFFSILCWSCGCVWSTFRDSVAWILEKTLALPDSFALFSSMTLQENSFRWRTGSEASKTENTDLDDSRTSKPSTFGKYHQSLQTLKPVRFPSSQSVTLTTHSMCIDIKNDLHQWLWNFFLSQNLWCFLV